MDGLTIPALVTPVGIAVVGALLWWRVGHVERSQRAFTRRLNWLVSVAVALAANAGVYIPPEPTE